MDMCHRFFKTLPNSSSDIGLRAWRLGTGGSGSTPGTSSLATSFLGLFSVRYIASTCCLSPPADLERNFYITSCTRLPPTTPSKLAASFPLTLETSYPLLL
jgi:hypothetical protein